MQANGKILEVLEKMSFSISDIERVVISYNIELLGADLIQILGRRKRLSGKKI